MGRLSGFRHREVAQRPAAHGFVFARHAAGSHEIWKNPQTHRWTTVPCHPGDIPDGTLRAILRQAGISLEEFLNTR